MIQAVCRIAPVIAAVCLATGTCLAVAHPVCPSLAFFALLFIAPLSAARPWQGLLTLPALAPLLDFSPWTGWLVVEEFDLLVLAVLAGAYFRMWRDGSVPRRGKPLIWMMLAAACLLGGGAGGLSMRDLGSFAGYATPMNALRVGKSLAWTALLWPLLAVSRDALPRSKMLAEFFWAMLLGSVWVVLAIAWERAFFPGLWDIRTHYRTVGLFWEMHHGGAALDVYLVLIAPLLAWAWRRPLPPGGRLLLGLFILAFAYACLTTFSRGAVFAAAGAAILHGLLCSWQARRAPDTAGVRPASVLILALVCAEAFVIFGTDSFMNDRLRQTTHDFGGRLAHWERALGALKSPVDWLFGIGLGGFPSHRVQRELGVVLPGGFEAATLADGTRGARLSGPDGPLAGKPFGQYFALSQRIGFVPGAAYRVSMKTRNGEGGQALALVRICASHLLYPARCSARIVKLEGGEWRERSVSLSGRMFGAEAFWRAMGHGVFLMSVLTPGAVVEISELRLEAGQTGLLSNPRFDGAGRWFPQSFHYFLPWHIDSFYLELLVETGVLGLAAFLLIVFRISKRLFRAYLAGEAFPVEFISAGAGVLALGWIVSILDAPRVAALAGLFLALSAAGGPEKERQGDRVKPRGGTGQGDRTYLEAVLEIGRSSR